MDTRKEWHKKYCQGELWNGPGRRKRGRPPITWIEEIQPILREGEIEEYRWMNKQQWKMRIQSIL